MCLFFFVSINMRKGKFVFFRNMLGGDSVGVVSVNFNDGIRW